VPETNKSHYASQYITTAFNRRQSAKRIEAGSAVHTRSPATVNQIVPFRHVAEAP